MSEGARDAFMSETVRENQRKNGIYEDTNTSLVCPFFDFFEFLKEERDVLVSRNGLWGGCFGP
jgi:hypothetical protein